MILERIITIHSLLVLSRMNPYGCISLEHRVGMIEVVLNADTIANIQKEKGMFTATAAFRKGPILGKRNI